MPATHLQKAFSQLLETGETRLSNGSKVKLGRRNFSDEDAGFPFREAAFHPLAQKIANQNDILPVSALKFEGKPTADRAEELGIIHLLCQHVASTIAAAEAGGSSGKTPPMGVYINTAGWKGNPDMLQPHPRNAAFEGLRKELAGYGFCWYHFKRDKQLEENWTMFLASDVTKAMAVLENGKSTKVRQFSGQFAHYGKIAEYGKFGRGTVGAQLAYEGDRAPNLPGTLLYLPQSQDAAIILNAARMGQGFKIYEYYPAVAGMLKVTKKDGAIHIARSNYSYVGFQGSHMNQRWLGQLIVPPHIDARYQGWPYHLLDFVFHQSANVPELPKKVAIPSQYFPEDPQGAYLALNLKKIIELAGKRGFALSEETARAIKKTGWQQTLAELTFELKA